MYTHYKQQLENKQNEDGSVGGFEGANIKLSIKLPESSSMSKDINKWGGSMGGVCVCIILTAYTVTTVASLNQDRTAFIKKNQKSDVLEKSEAQEESKQGWYKQSYRHNFDELFKGPNKGQN